MVRFLIETLQPSKRPELVEGLNRLAKFLTSVRIVEEKGGQLCVWGSGELSLDAGLFFLRGHFAKVEVRLTEPSSIFYETCQTISRKILPTTSLNKTNQIKLIVEPLDALTVSHFPTLKQLDQVRRRQLKDSNGSASSSIRRGPFFDYAKTTLNWDALTLKSFLALGQDHPALLLDEIFASQVERENLTSIFPFLIEGFLWALREGPLTEEPIRNIKVKITDLKLGPTPKHRSREQLMGMMRIAVHKALLIATPKFLEPYYLCEVTSTADALPIVYQNLGKRRAQLVSENPKVGTIFTTVIAKVPVLDSFGLETDIRTQALGQALVEMHLAEPQLMPGDPLDGDVKLPLTDPAEPLALSRDVMVKTRRRRGLPDDIPLIAYFEDQND
jgi:translation elongation factor EF-G